jgi:hypothetical protein
MIIEENDQTALSLMVNYIWNLIQNEKKQLFISIYGFQNKFEDYLASEEKKLQLAQQHQQKRKKEKIFFNTGVTFQSQTQQILNKVLLSALNKKLPSASVSPPPTILLTCEQERKILRLGHFKSFVWDILNLKEKSQTLDSKIYNNPSQLI